MADDEGFRYERRREGERERRHANLPDPPNPRDAAIGPPWRYAQILERAHHWAFRLTGDRDAADDLAVRVAEVVAAQLNGGATRYPNVPVGTWAQFNQYVARALLNRLRNEIDSEGRRTERESRYATEVTPDMLDTRTPDLLLERMEQRRALDAAIAELPERLRDYIICVHEQGMSYSQTADLLGVKRESVEAAIARAYKRLRPKLTVHRLSGEAGPERGSHSTKEEA